MTISLSAEAGDVGYVFSLPKSVIKRILWCSSSTEAGDESLPTRLMPSERCSLT